jgi:hypothetical protein
MEIEWEKLANIVSSGDKIGYKIKTIKKINDI